MPWQLWPLFCLGSRSEIFVGEAVLQPGRWTPLAIVGQRQAEFRHVDIDFEVADENRQKFDLLNLVTQRVPDMEWRRAGWDGESSLSCSEIPEKRDPRVKPLFAPHELKSSVRSYQWAVAVMSCGNPSTLTEDVALAVRYRVVVDKGFGLPYDTAGAKESLLLHGLVGLVFFAVAIQDLNDKPPALKQKEEDLDPAPEMIGAFVQVDQKEQELELPAFPSHAKAADRHSTAVTLLRCVALTGFLDFAVAVWNTWYLHFLGSGIHTSDRLVRLCVQVQTLAVALRAASLFMLLWPRAPIAGFVFSRAARGVVAWRDAALAAGACCAVLWEPCQPQKLYLPLLERTRVAGPVGSRANLAAIFLLAIITWRRFRYGWCCRRDLPRYVVFSSSILQRPVVHLVGRLASPHSRVLLGTVTYSIFVCLFALFMCSLLAMEGSSTTLRLLSSFRFLRRSLRRSHCIFLALLLLLVIPMATVQTTVQWLDALKFDTVKPFSAAKSSELAFENELSDSLKSNFAKQRVQTLSSHEGSQVYGDRILFVLRTAPKFYQTRLKAALETYLHAVPSKFIAPVGNSAFLMRGSNGTRNVSVLRTDEPDPALKCEDNHGKGMTCIEGRALFYAWERRLLFDWVFVVDDDVYVLERNLHELLAQTDMRKASLHTTGGCGSQYRCARATGAGGVCGGGGYALSRLNLDSIIKEGLRRQPHMNSQLHAWMATWMDIGSSTEFWSDITTGCAASELAGVATVELRGLSPWKKTPAQLVSLLNSSKPLPLTFHYVGKEGMPTMQQMHSYVTGEWPLQKLLQTVR